MTDRFDEITASLAISGWHAAWQSAHLQLQAAAKTEDDFVRIHEIGRAAMAKVPADQRQDALDTLYEAYWNNRNDWDIRRLLEGNDTLARAMVLSLHQAVAAARRAGRLTVTVELDHLAAVLEQLDTARLHRRHCPELNDDQDGGH